MKERSWRYAGLVVTEQREGDATAAEESEWFVELAGDENNGHWIQVGPDFAATLIGVLVRRRPRSDPSMQRVGAPMIANLALLALSVAALVLGWAAGSAGRP